MRYYRYWYKRRKLSTFGMAIAIIVLFIESFYKVLRYFFKKMYNFIKWLKNYYHFRHINLSYNQIILLIKQMSPRQFEVFLSELFRVNGFRTKLTPETCDGGKDIVLFDDNGEKIYVEAKLYLAGTVQIGREIVQKLTGACLIDGVKKAIIVTTGTFHNNAWECLDKLGDKDFELTFMDFDDIMYMVKETEIDLIPMIMATVFKETPSLQLIEN